MSEEDDGTKAEPGDEASDAIVTWLADHLDDSLNSVAGYEARVDPGENGQIWIALKGGIGDPDAEGGLLQALDHRLERLREDAPGRFDVEVSTGRMAEDLLVRCRVLKPASGSE